MIGLGGLMGAGLLWLLARRRAHFTQEALRHHTSLPGGGLLLGLATLTASGAAVALAYVAVDRIG